MTDVVVCDEDVTRDSDDVGAGTGTDVEDGVDVSFNIIHKAEERREL